MLNISIVEDSNDEMQLLKKCISKYLESLNEVYNIRCFRNAISFLDSYNQSTDIVFLDIQMPGLDGLMCANELRKIDQSTLLVFVTSCQQYALDGYKYDASDYIVKPYTQDEILVHLKRILKKVKKNDNVVCVKTEDGIKMIAESNIKYIEVEGHYLKYHTVSGIFLEYATLKSVVAKIKSKSFCKCNRCYLINFSYVSEIKKDIVEIDGDMLVISRNERKPFLQAYSLYLGDML